MMAEQNLFKFFILSANFKKLSFEVGPENFSTRWRTDLEPVTL